MPIFRYFAFVGGLLLALLFAADRYLPTPVERTNATDRQDDHQDPVGEEPPGEDRRRHAAARRCSEDGAGSPDAGGTAAIGARGDGLDDACSATSLR
ncbi:hypothetical protein H8B02_12075 [Bradyrhizobium sp. Pear77]|uniref:hypothetical protein n=1 Tax=Bradyrhizobium altum TaxID=1571202 RepID=UPI001E337386|nr:hypothetical protein [Bradyrhizobium altum]MCC8954163.1 hypothetical protein [Bradyrhizobium altum]